MSAQACMNGSKFLYCSNPARKEPDSTQKLSQHCILNSVVLIRLSQLGSIGGSCLTSLKHEYLIIQPHQHCQCPSYADPTITHELVQQTKVTTVLPIAKAKGKHKAWKIHQRQVTETISVEEEENVTIDFKGR